MINNLPPELVEASKKLLESKKYKKAAESKYTYMKFAGLIALENDKLKGDGAILKALAAHLKKDGKSSAAINNLMNDDDFVSDTISAYNKLVK